MVCIASFSTYNAAAITPIVELDKSPYTWTDIVKITVTAPDQNLDSNKIETIGNNDTNKITISDRGNTISPYALVETGPNTGIFTGYVTLTGDPTLKGPVGVDGNGTNPSGLGPSGIGPTDGLLPAEDSDGISVLFQTQDHNATGSLAMIRWNVGQVTWLPSDHTPSSKVLQIIDPDMHLNPNATNSFFTPVWSNSDFAGVLIPMTETGSNTGIFQGTVDFTNDTSSGNRLHISSGNNTIIGEYTDRTLPALHAQADQLRLNATTYVINNAQVLPIQNIVELDKTSYTWTNRVNITVIAPDQNLDPTKIDIIGNTTTSKITISTRGHTISQYKLIETGPNTGNFTGYVTLTGNPLIKGVGGIDGQGTEPTGTGPSGIGPNDGLLPSQDSDGISVSFQTLNQTVVAFAPIHWNVGNVTWLESSYPSNGQGVLQIVDPDMNLNPNAIDRFYTNTWSDSDSGGIKFNMTETGSNTGIFQGTVYFTTNFQSSGNRLHVAEGDTVTGEYQDRTLPAPYTPAYQLRLTSTTLVGIVPPPERVSASDPRIVDSFGNTITSPVIAGQQMQIAADLTNNQNRDQPFAYLVQIQDQNGVTVSLSWITGTLTANQTLTPAQSWTPHTSGTYTAEIFVLQSIDNPLPLSQPLATTIVVEGGGSISYNITPVSLSGIVNTPIQGGTAILLILDPNHNFVQIVQANVTSNGTFSTVIKAGGPLFRVTGNYTIMVEYGGTLQNNLSFNYNATSNTTTNSSTPSTVDSRYPRLVDSLGNTLTSIYPNQQIQITAQITNRENSNQPFTYLVNILDKNGNVIDASWISGTLTPHQSLDPAQSLTLVTSGGYIAQIYIIKSIDNPIQLSPSLVLPFIVGNSSFSNSLLSLSGFSNSSPSFSNFDNAVLSFSGFSNSTLSLSNFSNSKLSFSNSTGSTFFLKNYTNSTVYFSNAVNSTTPFDLLDCMHKLEMQTRQLSSLFNQTKAILLAQNSSEFESKVSGYNYTIVSGVSMGVSFNKTCDITSYNWNLVFEVTNEGHLFEQVYVEENPSLTQVIRIIVDTNIVYSGPSSSNGGSSSVLTPMLIPASNDAGIVGISAPNSISDLSAISTSNLATSDIPSGKFPYGLFSWKITGLVIGQKVPITFSFPSTIPSNAQYWKFSTGTWTNLSSLITGISGNTMTISITDGGLGDADGLANGIISDPGGLFVPSTSKGDKTPGFAPSFTVGFAPNRYPLVINGTGINLDSYQNSPVQTQVIHTGKSIVLKIFLYGDSGPSSVQHVTLFTDLYGNKRNIGDSDTMITWDRNSQLSIVDPHNFFGSASANPTQTSDGKFELDVDITFANPMPTSDIIVRTWGSDLYSADTYISNAWQVVGSNMNDNNSVIQIQPAILPQSTASNQTDLITVIKEWGGYTPTSISDSELLSKLGIKANHIPSWMMKTTKWVVNDEMTEQEFVNAVKYLYANGMIK
ncbi:MAG: choice-of-anchor U domain-containing protein [Nitrosopumilaceae archaeon]